MEPSSVLSISKISSGSGMAKSPWILSIPVMAVVTPSMLHMQCRAKKVALSPNGTGQQNRSGLHSHSPSWLRDKAMSEMNINSLMVTALIPPLAQLQQTSPQPKLPCLLVRRCLETYLLMGYGRQTICASLMCGSLMFTQSCTGGRN
ncbi:hypothetical protein ACHAXS_003112 [Conticribra weissflogii]